MRSEVAKKIGERALREAFASGVLKQIWRGVVVHAADASRLHTRAHAALLAAGEPSVLSGLTSLALHGITAVDTTPIHLTVPYSRAVRSKPGLVVHQAAYDHDDVIELDELATFPLDLALSEVLCEPDKRTAIAALDQALHGLPPDHQDKLREHVRQRLDDRLNRRGIHRAEMLLDLATGKAESPPESVLLLVVVEAGLPIPEVQYEITTIDGHKLYVLDLAWPEHRIALEYDGFAAHEERSGYDAERDRRMAGRGWITVRASAGDLRDSGRLMGELTAAFSRRGAQIADTRAGNADTRAQGAS